MLLYTLVYNVIKANQIISVIDVVTLVLVQYSVSGEISVKIYYLCYRLETYFTPKKYNYVYIYIYYY